MSQGSLENVNNTQTVEEKKENLSKELVEQTLGEFMLNMRQFKVRCANLSQKALARAMAFAMNDGLTTYEVNLLNKSERDFAMLAKRMFQQRTILHAGQLKFNKEKENVNNEIQ